MVVTLDDVLVEDGRIAAFHEAGPTHVAMGRFGNVMLTGGETNLALGAHVGEVVRFYFTNTANTRLFNVALPGARMKLVGSDSGRYEHETFVEEVLLAPSERAIVDVRFDTPGATPLEHRTPGRTYTLGTVDVDRDGHDVVGTRRRSTSCAPAKSWRAGARASTTHVARRPDKTLAFKSLMPLLYGDTETDRGGLHVPDAPRRRRDRAGDVPAVRHEARPRADRVRVPDAPRRHVGHRRHVPEVRDAARPAADASAERGHAARARGHEHAHAHDTPDGLEWEDLMPEINAASNAHNMIWKLVDVDTGKENWEIDWAFRVGDLVKIRLLNDMDQDHPMHHPFHIHGAGRFLILARDDVVEPNLAWKDTVLVRSGETVDILLEVTNPGLWMAHCHIAEHNQSGMMFSFPVRES